jgi:hypothetical protein
MLDTPVIQDRKRLDALGEAIEPLRVFHKVRFGYLADCGIDSPVAEVLRQAWWVRGVEGDVSGVLHVARPGHFGSCCG